MPRNVIPPCWRHIANRSGQDMTNEINDSLLNPGVVCIANGDYAISGPLVLRSNTWIYAYSAQIKMSALNLPMVETEVQPPGSRVQQYGVMGGRWIYNAPGVAGAKGIVMGNAGGDENLQGVVIDALIQRAEQGILIENASMTSIENLQIDASTGYAFEATGGTRHHWGSIWASSNVFGGFGAALQFRLTDIDGLEAGNLGTSDCAEDGFLFNNVNGNINNITTEPCTVISTPKPPGIPSAAMNFTSCVLDIGHLYDHNFNPTPDDFDPTASDTALLFIADPGAGGPSCIKIHFIENRTVKVTPSPNTHYFVHCEATASANRLWNKCAATQGFGNFDPSGVIQEFDGV